MHEQTADYRIDLSKCISDLPLLVHTADSRADNLGSDAVKIEQLGINIEQRLTQGQRLIAPQVPRVDKVTKTDESMAIFTIYIAS